MTLKSLESGITFKTDVYNAFSWTENNSTLPEDTYLLPLHTPVGDYNPCDVSTLTKEAISSVLVYFNITGDANSVSWIGYVEREAIFDECGVVPYDLYYSPYIAVRLQALGATGGLYGFQRYPWMLKFAPPSLTIAYGFVDGERVHMPMFAVDTPKTGNKQWVKELTKGHVITVQFINFTPNLIPFSIISDFLVSSDIKYFFPHFFKIF